MIRSPIGLRLNRGPGHELKAQLRQAASLGAKGVVLEATGDLSPRHLGETGRRELKHVLRNADLALVALVLPTRRPFDRDHDLDDRLERARTAFELAFELGCTLALVHPGPIPPESETARQEV